MDIEIRQKHHCPRGGASGESWLCDGACQFCDEHKLQQSVSRPVGTGSREAETRRLHAVQKNGRRGGAISSGKTRREVGKADQKTGGISGRARRGTIQIGKLPVLISIGNKKRAAIWSPFLFVPL